jgi:uncharacterized protein (DUF362 family)
MYRREQAERPSADGMDRRRFLNRSARWLASGLLLPGAFLSADGILASVPADPDTPSPGSSPDTAGQEPNSFPDLVVAKGEPREATMKAIALIGGMARFVRSGQVVVLKPNAGFDAPPEWGATTHPEVVAAVIDACIQAGARRVLILDHTLHPSERCFKRTGLEAAVAAFPKAKLVSMDDPKAYVEIPVPSGVALRTTQIPLAVQKADLLINLPTAKSHSATGVSLGLKNLMGLVWDRRVFHQEIDLHQGIADLATVLRPQLTILAALRILKTGGPTGPGDVDPQNKVIAGIDPVAVDAFGVGLSTWNRETLRPDQVGYIRYAAQHGLGTMKLDSLRIVEQT